ncbi:MAG TPA: aminopeptidase [Oligoflexia bacterium]|nr:aminopeptidase [Oligoflexia bacterium]
MNKLFVLSIVLLTTTGCSSASYLVQAGRGQLAIYNRERPLEEVIQDDRVSLSLRNQLREVPEIKAYVAKTLGVAATSNYKTFSDLKRKYAIWVLSSSARFELKLKTWSFPIVGTFPYLGFFDEEMAREWSAREQAEGQDTYVRGASAYSMLGFLREPLLSTMLQGRKEDLVNLIFHETLHSHVYLDGQGAFNEQIASYFGDYGELQYLVENFGSESEQVQIWKKNREDRRRMGALLREFERELAALYENIKNLSNAEKEQKKKLAFDLFKRRVNAVKWHRARTGEYLSERVTNNATVLAFLTYEDEQGLYDLLHEKSKGDLAVSLRLVQEFAKHYASSKAAEKPQRLLESFLRERTKQPL